MKWTWLLALLFILSSAHAQSGFFMPANQKRVEIPFEYVNDFILVKLHFKGAFELRFIFDTGAEHTILSKREIADIWNLPFERSFPITGSDLSTPIIAHLVRRIKLDIPEKATAPGEDILVLQEDYFRFEEYAGVNVHGILSAGAFSRYIIEIDYIRKKIILHDRDFYKIKESEYIALPLEIYRNKPYITTKLHIQQDSVIDVKLLLDTGAGLPLMLFSNLHPLIHPPQNAIPANIGMGLGGFLEGYTGRIHDLELGTHKQGGVLTYFQELDTMGKSNFLNGRNGILGNGTLNRFSVILDYRDEKVWLKPNRNINRAFTYDRSGLQLLAYGLNLNQFNVQSVLPGSPAAEADIRPGDQVMRIGRLPASLFSLHDLLKKLQKSPGTRIKIVVKRDGKRIRKTITLRDLV